MSDHTEEFLAGRQKGLDEALNILIQMEGRYRQWAHHNPGITGVSDSARGKIEAICTANRAVTNLKKLPVTPG